MTNASDLEQVRGLITRREGSPPEALRLEHRRLRGGLEAAAIDQVTARYTTTTGRARLARLVVKRLDGVTAREASVYRHVVTKHVGDMSPVLYGVEQPAPGRTLLYLEALRPVRRWPWAAPGAAQSVLERVASLHTRVPDAAALAALRAWDYEAELRERAAVTLERLERLHRPRGLWALDGALRWARRVVGALTGLRRQLLTLTSLSPSMIHGDLHPGNIVMRQCRTGWQPVLVDWGRARMGSPLEDVSCWLQSLGAWEPEARRRHDTLLTTYLRARGLAPQMNSEFRAAYWVAGASNALSGALAHHLSVMLDQRLPSGSRARAAYCAREWVRVLRRADAHCC